MTSKCKIIKYKLNANIFFQIYFCSTFSVHIQKVKINWKSCRLFERRHSKNTIWCESTKPKYINYYLFSIFNHYKLRICNQCYSCLEPIIWIIDNIISSNKFWNMFIDLISRNSFIFFVYFFNSRHILSIVCVLAPCLGFIKFFEWSTVKCLNSLHESRQSYPFQQSETIVVPGRMWFVISSFNVLNVLSGTTRQKTDDLLYMQNRFCFQYPQCSIHRGLSNRHY